MTQVVFCKYAIQAYLLKKEPNTQKLREWRNISIYSYKEEALRVFAINKNIVKNNPPREFNQVRLAKLTNILEIIE